MFKDEAIVISVPDSYPIQLFDFVEKDLQRPDFRVRTITTERLGPMAGIEWMMPTVVVAYLTKAFFDAALSEAGKDFYEFVKSRMKKFISENRKVKTRLVAATISTKKLSKNYDLSHTISIKAFVHSKIKVTVLFNESIPDDELEPMLEGLFQVLQYFYIECQKQEPEKETELYNSEEFYLVGNLVSRQWEIVTRQQMAEKYR